MLWSLSLVPVADVVKVYQTYVLQEMPEIDESVEDEDEDGAKDYTKALEEYVDYFERTWVGRVNQRTQQRGRPTFKLEYWNHYNSVMYNS